MANYTDTEINEAVSRYVRSGLKIERSPLGPVDANSKFTEVLALVSSTLIYDPNAIFYLIYLSSNRLNANVLTAIEYVDDLLQAVNEMGKHTEDVTRTTLLGDAAAALLTVDQILTSKTALSSAAYSRYQTSLDQFIKYSLRPNIKTGTSIVRPPQEARRDALMDLGLISDAYATILADVSQLMSMLSEFLGLNLPVLAIQESVRLVRYDLQQLQTFFESTDYTKNDRIAKCRSAYLAITAGRSVLDNYTTATDPSASRMSSGASLVGRLVLPASTTIDPATVTSSKSGPWLIQTGVNDELKIAEDGNPSTTYVIPSFSRPIVRGYTPEPYDIVASPPPPGQVANDLIELDGWFPYVTLTPGIGRTAAQIAADINLWAVTYSYPYSASVLLEGGQNYVQIEKTSPGLARLTMTANFISERARMLACYSTLGFYEGQSDDSVGVSAAEVAAVLNGVGAVAASVSRTLFEEGETSTYVDVTHVDLPPNSLASTAHVDDQILFREGESRGYHRIVSVTRLPGADRVEVSSLTPLVDAGSWLVLRERLTVASKSVGMEAKIVISTANANTTIGFTVSTHEGQTTGFRAAKSGLDVDFTQYNVEVGDYLYLTTSTSAEAKFTIVEMTSNNQQLEFTPALPVSSTITAFRIVSAAAEAYSALVAAITAWNSAVAASKFKTDTLELDRVMNPLLTNENPSLSQIADARNAISSVTPPSYGIRVLLTQLSTALVAYVVAAVGRIEAALRMLRERGMDRAYDLLMRGEVATFFGMDKDDAASSSFMLKSMRSLVQQDLPISKLEDDVDDDVVKSSAMETSADLDYSDQDTDENVRILGEVPDFDNPNDATITSKVGY